MCCFLKGVRAHSLSPSCALSLSPSLFLLPSKGTLLSLRHLSFSFLLVGLRVCGRMGWAERPEDRPEGGKGVCLSVHSSVCVCGFLHTYLPKL